MDHKPATEKTMDEKPAAKVTMDHKPCDTKSLPIPEGILISHVAYLAVDRETFDKTCALNVAVKAGVAATVTAPWHKYRWLPTIRILLPVRFDTPLPRRIDLMKKGEIIPTMFSPQSHHVVSEIRYGIPRPISGQSDGGCFGLLIHCQDDPCENAWFGVGISQVASRFTNGTACSGDTVLAYDISDGCTPDLVVSSSSGDLWLYPLAPTSIQCQQTERLLLESTDKNWLPESYTLLEFKNGVHNFIYPWQSFVHKLGFACSGEVLVTINGRGMVKVRLKKQEYKLSHTFHVMRPYCICLSKNNSILAMLDAHGNIELWDVLLGEMMHETKVTGNGVLLGLIDMCISPDGNFVIVMNHRKRGDTEQKAYYLWFYHTISKNFTTQVVQHDDGWADKVYCNDSLAWTITLGTIIQHYKLETGERVSSYDTPTFTQGTHTVLSPCNALAAFISRSGRCLKVIPFYDCRSPLLEKTTHKWRKRYRPGDM